LTKLTLVQDQLRGAVGGLGEQVVNDQSGKEHQRELGFALIAADSPARLEND
jgi:hypothetical protein